MRSTNSSNAPASPSSRAASAAAITGNNLSCGCNRGTEKDARRTRTKRFYDAALKPLGYRCLSEGEGSLGYGKDAVTLWISSTDRPVPADLKLGLHFCFVAPTPRSIEAFHAAALSNGGRDNGTPGLRADYSPDYYAAFVIDPDGYRLEAHCSRSVA